MRRPRLRLQRVRPHAAAVVLAVVLQLAEAVVNAAVAEQVEAADSAAVVLQRPRRSRLLDGRMAGSC